MDAFLAQEIGKPSPASGIEDISNADDGSVMWLVENQRPTTMCCYSGTLSHRSQGKDQHNSTIYAFSHFVYGHSNKTLVITDLQGISTFNLDLLLGVIANPMLSSGTSASVKSKDGLVLFDPMTHTVEGSIH